MVLKKGFFGGGRALSRAFSLGVWLAFGLGAATAAPASTAGASNPSATLPPRAVLERFDSLVTDGSPASLRLAHALTTGTARRLFPVMAETHAKFAPFLDTAQSRETVLDERYEGRWAVLKIRIEAAFTMPFLGMERLTTVQAVHLFQDPAGWKIADFEELEENAKTPPPRTGVPAGAASPASLASPASAGEALLPLSRLAPSKDDMPRVTRMRLRVSLRDGDSLSLPTGMAGQRVIPSAAKAAKPKRGSGSPAGVEVETTIPTVIDSLYLPAWDDTLAAYRASTTELDLTDKALRTRAAKLKQGSPHQLETTRRIWRYVSTSFDYKLGATLFATSREALRTMKGDCSEAAVLTAALLRSAGIPSRVVLGYATLENGVWIGHAWAEANLGGRWVGVDAALKEFPAGASRVGLLALSGERGLKAEATNLMMRTLSNLDIQITGAWAGDTAIPLVEHPEAAAAAQRFWDQILQGMGR